MTPSTESDAVHEPLVPEWPWQVATALDAAALVVAALFSVMTLAGTDAARPLVLLYLLFFLGWSLLRAAGATATTLTAVGAVGAGIALTIATSFLAVTLLAWHWQTAVNALVALGLVTSVLHQWRSHR